MILKKELINKKSSKKSNSHPVGLMFSCLFNYLKNNLYNLKSVQDPVARSALHQHTDVNVPCTNVTT